MEHEFLKALKTWKTLYRIEERFINLKQAGLFKFKDSTLIMGICKNGIVSIRLTWNKKSFYLL